MRTPYFKLVYNGRDLSGIFGEWPTEITYTDKKHGESDEVMVKVHNSTGQWLEEWMPQNGDTFTLDYGYEDETVPAGEFTVDEFAANGGARGDSVDFKGLSTPSTEKLRTKNSKPYENQSLREIAQKIASEHGMTVEGEIEDITFERVTQNGERDLEFLKRLAEDSGHDFTIKGKKLIFTSRDALRAEDPVRVIDRTLETEQTLLSYNLRNSDRASAKKAVVRYYHPKRKKVIEGEASSSDDLGIMTNSGDTIMLDIRVENDDQAKRLAKSRLDKKNSEKMTGDFDLLGEPLLVAGQVIELKNFGSFDGRYIISESKHTLKRNGYTTQIRIELITEKQQQAGKKVKAKNSGSNSASGGDNLGTMGSDGNLRP